MMKTRLNLKETHKITIMAILLAVACFLTYYFQVVLETGIIFTHFFYIPIILACIWWKRKGLGVAIFLAVLLILSSIFVRASAAAVNDCLRALMFIAIAFVVAILSEQISKALKALKKERNFSQNIIATVPESLVVLDKDLRIKSANRTFYETFQTEPDKVTGSSIAEILHDKDGRLSAELAKLFGTEAMLENFELCYKSEKLGGRVFDITARGLIHAEEEEEEEEALVVIRDRTVRKRAEEELRKLNQEMEWKVEERTKQLAKARDYVRHLIESSPDFQMTMDKDGRIMDVNEAFEEIVGKSRDDIIGQSIYEYLPKEETERAIAEILEKKKRRNIELRAHIPAKGDLILDLSGTVFTTPEGDEGIYATGRDMTELREKEAQLIHAGRLASLGEMAAGVAHEINQPLSVVSMAAESTLRDIEKNLFDVSGLPGDLEDIMRNVGRIDRIITHMRTFARKPEEWRRVEPEEALNNAFILLGEQFEIHGISVSHKIEDNLPLIEVDANQLEQVFVNILINAQQMLDERGEEAERSGEDFEKRLVCGISRKKENEHEWVVFEFADNAYGVPDGLKRKIFEPFFTTKEVGEGTGLGLSIAYDIVIRSLSGKIWVEDNEMGGASFKVAVAGKKTEVISH